MSSDGSSRDHINVIHPGSGKRFRLNIRGDVSRLSVGRLKDCLAQSRCPVARARMTLCLNGVALQDDRDACADLGIRCGTTLTVEEDDDARTASSRPSAGPTEASASVANRLGERSGASRAAVALTSLPRRQLELQTLEAQENFLHKDRWEREAAIHDTLNQLDSSLAASSVRRHALTLERERADRALRLVVGREKQLETERERLARLREDEARRAAAREEELAARRAELSREQEAIRAMALLKLENERRLADIAHAREQYETERERVQAEQAVMDAQYRDRVLAVTTRQLAIETAQLAHEREAEELAWERRFVEEQRATYKQQQDQQQQRQYTHSTSQMDASEADRRASPHATGATFGLTTPRPSQRPPTSYPHPHPRQGTTTSTTTTAAAAEPVGMNRSHPLTASPEERHTPPGSSPLQYRRPLGGGGPDPASRTEHGQGRQEKDAAERLSTASRRGPARREPGQATQPTTTTTATTTTTSTQHAQSQQHAHNPYVVERPSIRHQNDGLSPSRETPMASGPRYPTHASASSASLPDGLAHRHGPARDSLGLNGEAGRGDLTGLGRGQPAFGGPASIAADMSAATTSTTMADALTHVSSGATSLGPRAPRHAQHGHRDPEPGPARHMAVTPTSASSLVVMEDGGYYAPEENAVENLQRLGEALGFVGEDALAFDRNRTCIVNLSDAYTLLVTYDVSTERLYVYATLLTAPSLQSDEKLRLGLYEMLLEGSLLGREVCGGGISASLKKDFILMSTSLFMPTSQPWSLRTLVPSFLQALQHWREQVAAYMHAHGHGVQRGGDTGGGEMVDAARTFAPPPAPAPAPAPPLPTAGTDESAGWPASHPRGISVLRHETASGSLLGSAAPSPPIRPVPVIGVDVTDTLVVDGVPTRYHDGVLVLQVAGPAAAAGLRRHDRIEHVNGVAVESTAGFGHLVRALVPGTVASLRVVRQGLPMDVCVHVGAAKVTA